MRLMGGDASIIKMFEEFSEAYKNKSEEEIMEELDKLKRDFQQDPQKYQKHLEALAGLKNFLDDEQREKLEKWLEYFNS